MDLFSDITHRIKSSSNNNEREHRLQTISNACREMYVNNPVLNCGSSTHIIHSEKMLKIIHAFNYRTRFVRKKTECDYRVNFSSRLSHCF